jgi:hypothetical protein
MCVHTQQRLRRVAYIAGKFGSRVAYILGKFGGAAAKQSCRTIHLSTKIVYFYYIQQRLSHSGTQMVGLIHTCFPLARSTNF